MSRHRGRDTGIAMTANKTLYGSSTANLPSTLSELVRANQLSFFPCYQVMYWEPQLLHAIGCPWLIMGYMGAPGARLVCCLWKTQAKFKDDINILSSIGSWQTVSANFFIKTMELKLDNPSAMQERRGRHSWISRPATTPSFLFLLYSISLCKSVRTILGKKMPYGPVPPLKF